MGLAACVGGPYTQTFNSSTMGLSRDGWRLRQSVSLAQVVGDLYGDSIIDGFYRGGNVSISVQGIEYSNMIASAFHYGAGVLGRMGTIGLNVMATSPTGQAKTLVLTAVAGTTAATVPATLTAAGAAHEGDVDIEFAARNREVPLTFRLYPYTNSSNTVWAVLT